MNMTSGIVAAITRIDIYANGPKNWGIWPSFRRYRPYVSDTNSGMRGEAFSMGLSKLGTILFVMAAMTLLPFNAGAAPKSRLLKAWEGHDESSTQTIDHGAWDKFLKKYVRRTDDGVNRVTYGDVSDTDLNALKGYISKLETTDILQYSRDQQFAYWVNLYNAKTVDLVLDYYPVSSIKKIKGGLFNSGPWDSKVITVSGSKLSLNNVEHGILRPIWKDPRIHYVVNCASIGCPNLAKEAFTGKNNEKLLDMAAKDYVNHPRGVTIKNGKLYVSSIYEWYQADFGGTDEGVISHIEKYAKPGLKKKLQTVMNIYDDVYDWSLNGSM